jgi:hypothetical protein
MRRPLKSPASDGWGRVSTGRKTRSLGPSLLHCSGPRRWLWPSSAGEAFGGRHVREWIDTAGEFEALCSLANYSYEHPSDVFPELADVSTGLFEAEALAHPLMPEARSIRNDVQLGGPNSKNARLWIVSGSNMSGKSTLLRTIGINTVLAWAGAPVRATRLKISPLSLGASIRVQDSLQDGRSRFYAEITRLREIVALTSGGIFHRQHGYDGQSLHRFLSIRLRNLDGQQSDSTPTSPLGHLRMQLAIAIAPCCAESWKRLPSTTPSAPPSNKRSATFTPPAWTKPPSTSWGQTARSRTEAH